MLIYNSEIKAFFGIDNVVIPLFSGFSITSNEFHQKLCIMALVIRWSSLASIILFIWQQVAINLIFQSAMIDLLEANVSKYCVQKLSIVDELDPHLAKHQWHLKL